MGDDRDIGWQNTFDGRQHAWMVASLAALRLF